MKAIAFAVLMSVSAAFAQQQKNTVKVILDCTCEDSTGQAYESALKDRIAKSPRYTEVVDTPENRKRSILLSAVSMDDTENKTGANAAFADVVLIDGTYLDHWVQECSHDIAAACAERAFDLLDKDTSKLLAAAATENQSSSIIPAKATEQ
jgi:hypothetical protein